jgi:hypothetical protein
MQSDSSSIKGVRGCTITGFCENQESDNLTFVHSKAYSASVSKSKENDGSKSTGLENVALYPSRVAYAWGSNYVISLRFLGRTPSRHTLDTDNVQIYLLLCHSSPPPKGSE